MFKLPSNPLVISGEVTDGFTTTSLLILRGSGFNFDCFDDLRPSIPPDSVFSPFLLSSISGISNFTFTSPSRGLKGVMRLGGGVGVFDPGKSKTLIGDGEPAGVQTLTGVTGGDNWCSVEIGGSATVEEGGRLAAGLAVRIGSVCRLSECEEIGG